MKHEVIAAYIGLIFLAIGVWYQRRAFLLSLSQVDANVIKLNIDSNFTTQNTTSVDGIDVTTNPTQLAKNTAVRESSVTTTGRRMSRVPLTFGFTVLLWRASYTSAATSSDVFWCSLASVLLICGFLMSLADYIITSIRRA